MDCSLSTWPSISQYDEFLWSGLGDLDQFFNLDRTKADASRIQAEALCTTVNNQDMDFQQSSDFYEPSPPVDLDSVLGSSMPESVPSAPVDEDNEFEICFGHMLIRSSQKERMNILLGDPMTDSSDTAAAIDRVSMGDSCEFMCFADNNTVQVQDESRAANPSMMDPFDTTPNNRKCEDAVQTRDVKLLRKEEAFHSEARACMGSMRPPSDCDCDGLIPTVRFISNNPHDSIEELQTTTFQSIGIVGPCMPWPPDRELDSAILHSSKLSQNADTRTDFLAEHGGINCHEQIQSLQQLVLPSAVELEKAQQDSQARRLAASKRRSRKYPLQKLIRMSSAASSTREKIGNSSEIPLQMVCSAASAMPLVKPQTSAHFRNIHDRQFSHGNHKDNQYCEDVGSLSTHDASAQACIVETTKPLQISEEFLDTSELEHLQNVLQKMNTELRLQIRDAFYRLAESAKLRQTTSMLNPDSSTHEMEAQTNPVDRWIANLLFSKA